LKSISDRHRKWNWPMRNNDVFSDEQRAEPITAPMSAGQGVGGEPKVETGPIFHLALLARNIYLRAEELKLTGTKDAQRALEIVFQMVEYGMSIRDEETGFVVHGPYGKRNDKADQRFGFDPNAPEMAKTVTTEHQGEFYAL